MNFLIPAAIWSACLIGCVVDSLLFERRLKRDAARFGGEP